MTVRPHVPDARRSAQKTRRWREQDSNHRSLWSDSSPEALRFVADFLLEGTGFEPSVPRDIVAHFRRHQPARYQYGARRSCDRGVTMATPAEAQPSASSPNPRCARARRSVLPVLRAAGADIASAGGPAPVPPRERSNPDARSRSRRYSAHGFSARNRECSIALAKNARWRFNWSRSRLGKRSGWPEFRTSETTSATPEHNPCADNESRASDASPTLSGAAGPALH